MKETRAREIIEKVKQDYTLIANEFSRTRSFFWPELESITHYIKKGDKVLDIGCGNGRLYPLVREKGGEYMGVDNVRLFVDIAQKKWPQAKFLVADALNLPFKKETFDKVFSIAVLHHIPSKELRRQFINEAKRVLKKNGLLILTVWRLPFSKRWRLFLKSLYLKLIKKEDIDWGDLFIPWGKKTERYVHHFSKKELKILLQNEQFKIEQLRLSKRVKSKYANILVVAKKI